MLSPLPADQLYEQFERTLQKSRIGDWLLAVFEGSPSDGAYSWCDDCVAASGDLRTFAASYVGPVKLLQFKVGTKEEWEGGNRSPNAFKSKFPFLSDIPTAILFNGHIDVARFIAPRKQDLEYLCGRAVRYEEQAKSNVWHPTARNQADAESSTISS